MREGIIAARIITEYAEVIVDSVNKVKRYEEALDDILQNDGNGHAGEIAFKALNQEKDDD